MDSDILLIMNHGHLRRLGVPREPLRDSTVGFGPIYVVDSQPGLVCEMVGGYLCATRNASA